ncbi:SPOR domain-containing protein [Leyella stercorea]|uniref:SPOR domain-containing protein n=1 Tax=Leyella stercorea TaxID=363265 RepID=UPI00242AA786|nr:SPOR domain-containing protein [Leyella stercorea]
MKRLFILSCLIVCITTIAHAQTYTQHLQEKVAGKGSVVVTQSEEIDKLVNTTNVNPKQQEAASKPKPADHPAQPPVRTNKNQEHETTVHNHTPHHEATTPHGSNTEPATATETTVDTSKKVMRRAYKTNGYRVQVFAGGNSRNDKIKAQQAGNAVKAAFPSHPIYVHFYSPRWICRMGNYRTYEEASAILEQVKKLGYKQACIVRGKISVAY